MTQTPSPRPLHLWENFHVYAAYQQGFINDILYIEINVGLLEMVYKVPPHMYVARTPLHLDTHPTRASHRLLLSATHIFTIVVSRHDNITQDNLSLSIRASLLETLCFPTDGWTNLLICDITHAHTCANERGGLHMYVCMHACVYVFVFVFVFLILFLFLFVFLLIFIFILVSVFVFVYVLVLVSVYVYCIFVLVLFFVCVLACVFVSYRGCGSVHISLIHDGVASSTSWRMHSSLVDGFTTWRIRIPTTSRSWWGDAPRAFDPSLIPYHIDLRTCCHFITPTFTKLGIS